MIKKGDTIVYKHDDEEMGMMFYWLVDILPDGYVFIDWYANPRKALSTDFWKISSEWFNKRLEEGKIEIYDSLPLDKYGDVFERQAMMKNAR